MDTVVARSTAPATILCTQPASYAVVRDGEHNRIELCCADHRPSDATLAVIPWTPCGCGACEHDRCGDVKTW